MFDNRHQSYVRHSFEEIALQRVCQIVAGYEDANDCDDTNSNTHGGQQLSLFNDYYGEYCYMPLHIYEGLSGTL